jgi:hypothetical protein
MVSQHEVDGLDPAPFLDATTRPGWRARAARHEQAIAAPAAQAPVASAVVVPEPAVNEIDIRGPEAPQEPALNSETAVTKRKDKRKFDHREDGENLRRSKRIAELRAASQLAPAAPALKSIQLRIFRILLAAMTVHNAMPVWVTVSQLAWVMLHDLTMLAVHVKRETAMQLYHWEPSSNTPLTICDSR